MLLKENLQLNLRRVSKLHIKVNHDQGVVKNYALISVILN